MGKKTLKKIGLTIGGLALFAVVTWSATKVVCEAFDYKKYSMECVKAKETVVDFPYISEVTLKICTDIDKPIEMEMTKEFRSEEIYTMYVLAEFNFHKTKGLQEKFTVYGIEMDGRQYTRETGPQELLDKANEKFKGSWGKAGFNGIVLDWHLWKSDEETRLLDEGMRLLDEEIQSDEITKEKKQYGDTIENLLRKLD